MGRALARAKGRLRQVELNPLGERQVGAVIDGVGRAPHIGAPAVRTALAAAAGILLAAERAADLCARRTNVDVGDPAIRAGGRDKPLGLAQIGREDRAAEALGYAIVERDGF